MSPTGVSPVIFCRSKGVDFLLNVLIWVGVVIFFIFIVGFMAAAKLNSKKDDQ